MKKIYFRPQSETIALHTEERFMNSSPNEAYDEKGNCIQMSRGKKRGNDFYDDFDDAFDDESAE